jgi:hypothetical protein
MTRTDFWIAAGLIAGLFLALVALVLLGGQVSHTLVPLGKSV